MSDYAQPGRARPGGGPPRAFAKAVKGLSHARPTFEIEYHY